jgi:hypothetical protein
VRASFFQLELPHLDGWNGLARLGGNEQLSEMRCGE